jgi:hypothetical protein
VSEWAPLRRARGRARAATAAARGVAGHGRGRRQRCSYPAQVKLGIAGTIFSKFEAFFAKASMRGGWTAGSISLEFEGLFGKWLGLTRSGPSVSPIGRSRTASDVASFPGLLISQVSYVKDYPPERKS